MVPLPLDEHIMKAPLQKAVGLIHVATTLPALPYMAQLHNLQPGMQTGRLQILLVNSSKAYVKHWFSNLGVGQNHPETLIKVSTTTPYPSPEYLIQWVWVSGKICISQGIVMLLVWNPN